MDIRISLGQYGQLRTIWTTSHNMDNFGQDGQFQKTVDNMDKIGQLGQLRKIWTVSDYMDNFGQLGQFRTTWTTISTPSGQYDQFRTRTKLTKKISKKKFSYLINGENNW